MDADLRRAMRCIYSTGRSVEMVVELIKDMRDEDRRQIDNWLRFLREREQRHWILGAGYYDRYNEQHGGTRRRFLIKDLPDSTITRLINTAQCHRYWDRWVRFGIDEEEDRRHWHDEDIRYGRSTYSIILEEAEYRSILSEEQLYWKDLQSSRKMDIGVFTRIKGSCDTRGGHQLVAMPDSNVKCANCRRGVSNEEVSKFVRTMLRGRLREFAC